RVISEKASRSFCWSPDVRRAIHRLWPESDFEQVVERLARAGGAALGPGAPLDRRARREEGAVVSHIFWSDPRRQRVLRAFEPRARVEGNALDARMKIDAASRAAAVGSD